MPVYLLSILSKSIKFGNKLSAPVCSFFRVEKRARSTDVSQNAMNKEVKRRTKIEVLVSIPL